MFRFEHTYARDLEGTYVRQPPAVPPSPALVVLNEGLADELGLDPGALRDHAARWLSGAEVPPGAEPLAQAYAGHQFGGLSPQLGDGRAVLLGELVDRAGRRRDLQLKGSGRTPFSRGGDGKAALGPMLREYVIGEAMHALGVPTTRALAVTTTGERVLREERPPGAVLARVAASHLRVGTFEYFALRDDVATLGRLVAYTLDRHYPSADRANPALALLEAVRDAQARLVARWMAVGFVHGVMNTDNVALSGETIDYGPCAFVERHDPDTVFSSIDHQGRYAWGNQPRILGWNLARFATALLPVLDPVQDEAVRLAQGALDRYAPTYREAWLAEHRAKLGLASVRDGDEALLDELTALLRAHRPDHTLAFRALAEAARGDRAALHALVDVSGPLDAWVDRWLARLALDGHPADRAAAMDRVNPLVIPRNHQVEAVLREAVAGDPGPLHRLVDALRDPFTDRPDVGPYVIPAPDDFTDRYQTFCGT